MSENKKENKIMKLDAIRFALNNQIGWQKYVEAKLIFLCTLCAGSLGFLFEFIVSEKVPPSIYFKVTISCFALTTFIAFVIGIIGISQSRMSFDFKDLVKDPKYLISWDSVYYKDFDELMDSYKDYDTKIQAQDILVQHQVGSNHTRKKYKIFNWGIIIYAIGLLFLTSFTVFKLFVGQ